MILTIVFLILGLILVVYGSDILVDGASAVARKLGISEFVIGLTIVGFGTSCPELVVSLNGAFSGSGDISIGNVVGSNIFNTLLILGLTAVIAPIGISSENKRRDIPVLLTVTFFFILLCLKGSIGLVDGIIFLILFAAYMYLSFKGDKARQERGEESKPTPLWLSILMIAGGLAGLVLGGKLFVNNAVAIASAAGVSEKFIAVTLLAGGTSLPELATCIVAAVKKKGALALGNILGSNVFNILLILGCSALVTPLSTKGMSYVDLGVLLLSTLLILFSAFTGKEKNSVDRFDGALMLLVEAAYMVYLFVTL